MKPAGEEQDTCTWAELKTAPFLGFPGGEWQSPEPLQSLPRDVPRLLRDDMTNPTLVLRADPSPLQV